MVSSISSTEKRASRGRPRTDPVAQHFTMPRELSIALDAFAADQPEPAPSRPETIRRVLADHLRAKGYLPAGDDPEGVN